MRALLVLIRVTDGASAAAMVVLGGLLAGGGSWQRVLAASVAAFGAMSFTMAINDQKDQICDRANGRGRPLVVGSIGENTARQTTIAAAVVALGGAVVAGYVPLAMVSTYLCVGWLYSHRLKQQAPLGAPATVGILAGSTVVLGGIADHGSVAVLPAAATAGVFVFARELLKAARDESGDRVQGCRTFAVAFGTRLAIQGYVVISLLAGTIAATPLLVGAGRSYAAFAIVNLAYLVALAVYLGGRPTVERVGRVVNLSKVSWVLWISAAIFLWAV